MTLIFMAVLAAAPRQPTPPAPPPAKPVVCKGLTGHMIIVKVVDAKVDATGVVITIGRGTDAGIAVGDGGVLQDHGKRYPRSCFTITTVHDRYSLAHVRLTLDQIALAPDAAITPSFGPPGQRRPPGAVGSR